jgi:hypothetical protein
MKKLAPLLLTLSLLLVFWIPVFAEEHEHDWSLDNYEKYNDTQHKVVRECYDCGYEDIRYEDHNWTRETFMDREFNDINHYAYYECRNCGATRYVLEPHEYESIPYDYGYWNDNTCNAKYRCKTCDNEKNVATSHDWKPLTSNYDYEYVNDTYHKKSVYSECSKCKSMQSVGENEKHTLKFVKSGGLI